jgi:hypothetical protein
MQYFASFGAFAAVHLRVSFFCDVGAICQKSEDIVYDFVCISLSTSDIEKCFKFSDDTFI